MELTHQPFSKLKSKINYESLDEGSEFYRSSLDYYREAVRISANKHGQLRFKDDNSPLELVEIDSDPERSYHFIDPVFFGY